MQLLDLDDVRFTYPPRFRHRQLPGVDVDAGETDGGPDGPDAADDFEPTAEEPRLGASDRPTVALRGVSLSLEAGESVGLLGVVGAGRTTVLSLVTGVLRPDAGRVRIRGRATGLVASGVGFVPDLTAETNVIRNLTMLGERPVRARRLANEVFAFTGLAEVAERTMREISRPQVRWLAYAAAVHCGPSVFLADEDLAVGPPWLREAGLARLEQIPESGRGLLVATNKPALLRRLCTRGVVLHEGLVLHDGSVDDAIEVLRATRHDEAGDEGDDAAGDAAGDEGGDEGDDGVELANAPSERAGA